MRRNVKTPLNTARFRPAYSCGHKLRFDTWDEAEETATLHAQRDGILVLAYHCRRCDGWHNSKLMTFMRSGFLDPVRSVGAAALS